MHVPETDDSAVKGFSTLWCFYIPQKLSSTYHCNIYIYCIGRSIWQAYLHINLIVRYSDTRLRQKYERAWFIDKVRNSANS